MDPIADMFTSIRNAAAAKREMVVIPYSKIKMEILKLLQRENYIKDVIKRGRKTKKSVEVVLLYKENTSVISKIKKISKPGRRVYISVSELFPIGKGVGKRILSTSKGILTDNEAKKERVGGEFIGEIW